MTEFIFMLTRDDETVANALDVYDAVRGTNLRYVGFKDVGLPVEELRGLAAAIRADGREVMLEVVSERAEDELRSIRAAKWIDVDWVLGGSHPADAMPLIAGTRIRYCPFPGTVIGHPSLLRGPIPEIAADAAALTARPAVHGLDLLAYRYDGDVEALVGAVVAAATGPVIAAGSVDSVARIDTLVRRGVWGFTIGGAIFDGRFGKPDDIAGQVTAVLDHLAGNMAVGHAEGTTAGSLVREAPAP